ncbi:copper-translocating P-type ATPase, partial [Prevotella sp. MGM2]
MGKWMRTVLLYSASQPEQFSLAHSIGAFHTGYFETAAC